jgi:hypothetical protein
MKTHYRLQEEDKGGDGGAAPNKEAPAAEQKPTEEVKTPGAEFDEFGYEKTPDAAGKKADEPAEKKDEKPEEIKDPATGYGTEAPKEEPVEEKPVEKPAAEEIKLEFELDVKDLDEKEALKLKEFAKSHKLSKEVTQALADDKKAEAKAISEMQAERVKAEAKAVADLKTKWDRELRSDPKFGGENFAKNIHKVEKLMSEFMSDTKKVLTERKSMLPPYVMRDLSKLADLVYSTEKLVQGDPNKVEPEKKETDPLDFYT